MFSNLPTDYRAAYQWSADDFAPYFDDLAQRDLTPETLDTWMRDWTRLEKLTFELEARIYVATTLDTTDEQANQDFIRYQDELRPFISTRQQALRAKLLESGLEPHNFALPLRKMRVDVDLFRETNLPLQSEEAKLGLTYDALIGAQTIQWDGQELTPTQVEPVYLEQDRARREQAWRMIHERGLQDRAALNELWVKLLQNRRQQARNAGFGDDYRAYRWQLLKRFDYTPDDCMTFHQAIEEVVVPVAQKLREKRRQRLGVEALRHWDMYVDPLGRAPLKPYETTEELVTKLETIFQQVAPMFGQYFKTMRDEQLLDLENRKGKAPGGYCIGFPLSERPFIFMNAVGLHDDVQTLLHEGGHAFHDFEVVRSQSYFAQMEMPMEFAEVASMSMELLGAPYLGQREGGFYTDEDAARARVEHLENIIMFWPYMAVVDAFQHWVYTNIDDALNPGNCDAKWSELWDRFMGGIDYTGLEDIKATGWQRKLHIFHIPFYYVEYGLAQLGAVQIWANSLDYGNNAVEKYRAALQLGGTANLPDLFGTAGAQFGFNSGVISGAVELLEMTIEHLDPA